MKILIVTRVWSFIDDAVEVWRKKGYTILKSPVYNPELAKQVDVLFFDFIDPQIGLATHCPIGSKKKIIGRLHRCEYYLGMIPKAKADWSKIDTLVITSKYYYDLITNHQPLMAIIGKKTKIVHHGYGISRDKFKYRERDVLLGVKDKPVKIGWLAKNYAWRKDPIKALSCFRAIMRHYPESNWELHMAAGGGDRGVPDYWKYLDKVYPELKEKVIVNRWQPDVNKFLAPMDFFLNTSMNESFCCVIAEAAMKGIKPLVWDFESASYVWPRDWTFFSDEEMFQILESPYESAKYRQYIIDNYSLEQEMINLEGVMKI